MNHHVRTLSLRALLVAVLALCGVSMSAAATQDPAKADQPATAKAADKAEKAEKAEGGVTFNNRSRDTQNVLAVFGGEKCEEMTERAQITVEPGQSAAVESGDNQVCWCASTLGKVGNCTDWNKAKAGKSVTIR